MRNSGKLHLVGGQNVTGTKATLEDDVDALFRLPLAEFTAARNTLAARLKKAGSSKDADRVRALAKPSISVWTVNQLYWQHRESFDKLIESGERFHKAQASRSAGKVADMRIALDARRAALTHLSDLATSLLRDGGHNPAPDTIYRIRTTLEAISAYASRSDAPRPGRLIHDVDPPGFESLGSFVPGTGMAELGEKPSRVTPSQKEQKAEKPGSAPKKTKSDRDARQLEATRKAKVAVAKASLQEAKKLLSEARDRKRRLQAVQKKVDSEARAAEKRLEKARSESEDAVQRARRVSVEVKKAARSVDDAERAVAEASEELEKLFGASL